MFIKDCSERNFRELITGHYEKDEILIILAAEKEKENIDRVIKQLNEAGVKFIGGLFPAIVWGNEFRYTGFVIKKMKTASDPVIVKGLNSDNIYMDEFINVKKNIARKETALILVDGLTANIKLFLSKLFNILGASVAYIGGGTGSLSLEQLPSVFSNEGFFQDTAIVTFLKPEIKLSVTHGWKKIMGPFVATRVFRNVIKELNWQNPFEIYKNIVESDSGITLTRENFFEISKSYPFGMYRENSEDIVRDPIAVNENDELVCVGEVPENSALNILKGEPDNLIEASAEAAKMIFTGGKENLKDVFLIDCISRALFLGDRFQEELNTINKFWKGENEITGALTLGEISTHSKGILEFFNKTTVIGAFYE